MVNNMGGKRGSCGAQGRNIRARLGLEQQKRPPTKLSFCVLLVGIHSDATAVENSMALPQKVKQKLPKAPVIPLLGAYAKELKARTLTDICIPVIRAVLFTTDKRV